MPVDIKTLIGASAPVGFTGSAGVQGTTGFTGSIGIVTWSRKTANYIAVTGDSIIADTSGGTFAVTLPGSPVIGSLVTIADGGNWSINPLTVARNGNTIEGQAQDFSLDIKNVKVDFAYDGSTWQLYSSVGAQYISEQAVTELATSMAIALG